MEKRNIIIDCDPGIDDALAIMLACRSQALNILGITIVSGNTKGTQCANNTLQVLKTMGRTDITVYLGETKPLKREPITAEDTHADDGLGGCYRGDHGLHYKEGAVDFILDTLKHVPEVDIIALGPLTNIAQCLKKNLDVTRKMGKLTTMGGCYKSHGNCSPVAEFNYWEDPDAAELVYNRLNRPIEMVGLDVTREVVMTPNYCAMVSYFGGPVAELLVGMIQFYTDFHWAQEGTLGSVVNDPLAVAYYLDPTICDGGEYYVDIITEGKAIGMSMVDSKCITKHKPNATVVERVDTQRFFEILLCTLFPDHSERICEIINDPRYGQGGTL